MNVSQPGENTAMTETYTPRNDPPRSEEFQFSGDTLLAKIKEIIRAGNVRRVIIKNEEGRVLIDVPLTLGVVGTLLAPQLAAIGAIAALVLKGSIVIEKEIEPPAVTPSM